MKKDHNVNVDVIVIFDFLCLRFGALKQTFPGFLAAGKMSRRAKNISQSNTITTFRIFR